MRQLFQFLFFEFHELLLCPYVYNVSILLYSFFVLVCLPLLLFCHMRGIILDFLLYICLCWISILLRALRLILFNEELIKLHMKQPINYYPKFSVWFVSLIYLLCSDLWWSVCAKLKMDFSLVSKVGVQHGYCVCMSEADKRVHITGLKNLSFSVLWDTDHMLRDCCTSSFILPAKAPSCEKEWIIKISIISVFLLLISLYIPTW